VVVGASCMVPPNDKVSVRLAVPLWKRRRRAEGKGGGAGIRRERSHANSIFSTSTTQESASSLLSTRGLSPSTPCSSPRAWTLSPK
jgi:hypothetical protein